MPERQIAYTNPILPGFYPDPSIVRAGECFYLICSTFEYFPGVPVFCSRNLVDWEQIGHVLDRKEQLDLTGRRSSDGIYAPTLRYHEGVFYMITTDVRGIGNFYVTATDPAGPWSNPIPVPYGGIDPSLFFDDDGKVYVTAQQGADYDSHAIQYEIDIATGAALSEPRVIWHGDGGPWTEGPHLYKINGVYYMMSASGGTAKEHREIIGRGDNPYGPFELCPEPILTHRHLDHPIQYLGHADLTEDANGDWWAVFLGVRLTSSGYAVRGRETFLAPVIWKDGWPQIDNNDGSVKLIMNVDRLPGPPPKPRRTGGRDDFDSTRPDDAWAFLRNPEEGSWSLDERPGHLSLYGRRSGLSETGDTLFVGRRQSYENETFVTRLSFDPETVGDEAGLCARRDEQGHFEIGLKRTEEGLAVRAQTTVRGTSEITGQQPVSGGEIWLKIEARTADYALSFSLDGISWTVLGTGPAKALSPEDFVDKMCFTGVIVGLYATGNGHCSQQPARFDWFEWERSEEE